MNIIAVTRSYMHVSWRMAAADSELHVWNWLWRIELEFSVESCICRHHVSREFWTPSISEQLFCEPEESNPHDPYAVAIIGDNRRMVGHVPRWISAGCFLLLQLIKIINGRIKCEVSGPRQISPDLPQGGLEVPCTLTFSGEVNLVKKMKKLIILQDRSASANVPVPTPVETSTEEGPPADTITPKEQLGESSSTTETPIAISEDDTNADDDALNDSSPCQWLSHAGWILTDQNHSIGGKSLSQWQTHKFCSDTIKKSDLECWRSGFNFAAVSTYPMLCR